MTSRNYCLTFYTKPCHNDRIRYAIYGREICPTTGRLHWQSYIELATPMRMAGIKKLYNDNTIHIEKRVKSREEARDYCKKDKCYEEYGKWICGQGHRTDLESIVDQLQDGLKISEIMMENPTLYCKYRNGIKDIAGVVTKQQTKEWRDVKVTLITGPTGCGKTRHANARSDYKIQAGQLKWWQDYEGEEAILIDEYNNDMAITDLLCLLDGYQLRLDVKGTHTYANWNKVYITTNLTIDELHPHAKDAHRKALLRRITKIKNMW